MSLQFISIKKNQIFKFKKKMYKKLMQFEKIKNNKHSLRI